MFSKILFKLDEVVFAIDKFCAALLIFDESFPLCRNDVEKEHTAKHNKILILTIYK